jgi:hypothetical protein
MEEKVDAQKVFVEKPQGTSSPGRPTRRWKDNIKMDLGELGWGGMIWIHLAHDRNQWLVHREHGNKHLGSIKCWEILDWRLLMKDSAP